MYNSHIRPDLRSAVRVPISDSHVISISVNRPRYREYLSGGIIELTNGVSCIDQRFNLEQFIDIKLLGVEGNTEQWLSLTKPIAFCQNGKNVWAVIVSREDKIEPVLSHSVIQNLEGDQWNHPHSCVADCCVPECPSLEFPSLQNCGRHPSITVLEDVSVGARARLQSGDSSAFMPIIRSNLRADSPVFVPTVPSNLFAEPVEVVPTIMSNLRADSPVFVPTVQSNLFAEPVEVVPTIISNLRADSPVFVPRDHSSASLGSPDLAPLATNIPLAGSPALLSLDLCERQEIEPEYENSFTMQSDKLAQESPKQFSAIACSQENLSNTPTEHEPTSRVSPHSPHWCSMAPLNKEHQRSLRRQHLLSKSRVVFLRKLLDLTQV